MIIGAKSYDIVLARPGLSQKTDRHWSSEPPLGLAYIAATAREEGLRVAVIDAKALGHSSSESTVKMIREYSPDILGISAMTNEYSQAGEIAGLLKSANERCIVIVGGAHANALPSETLADSSDIDFAFAGEGDRLFTRENVNNILSGANLDRIRGLYGRGDNKSAESGFSPAFREAIDDLPFPAWDLFPRRKKYPVMTERGCPCRCVFCSHNSSQRIRRRPVEQVIEEIKWLHKDFQPDLINIEDETFGSNQPRTIEFLARLVEFNKSARVEFKAQTRVNCASPSMLELMKKAGFRYVEFGVESGDPEVLKNCGKGINPEQIEKAVGLARMAGLKVWLKFIIGLPGESVSTVRRTIELAVKLNPDRMSVAKIVAYPGSDIYRWAVNGENGYRMITNDWRRFDKYLSSSVELEGFPERTMRRLQFQMYFETYIRNSRFLDFARLILKNRSFIVPLLKRPGRSS